MITPDDLLAKLDESEELEKLEKIIDNHLSTNYDTLYSHGKIYISSEKLHKLYFRKLIREKYSKYWRIRKNFYSDYVYEFSTKKKSILDKFLEFFNKGK